MVSTIKFSQFTNIGDMPNNSITVGYGNGGNQQYNNPWTFLAPGTTAQRPAPSASIYNRLRFNTDLFVYEYYDQGTASWTELSGSGTGTVNPGLANNIAYYPFNGSAVSGLANASGNNQVLVFGSPPSWTTTPNLTAILDSLNNKIVNLNTVVNPVNYLDFFNSATGNAVAIAANGTDTDIAYEMLAKGAGSLIFGTTAANSAMIIKTGTAYQHVSLFNFANTNATQTYTWPDATGTLALTSNIPSLPLSMANGGTGANLSPSNGGIVYTNASTMAILAGTATANLPLLSGASAAPSWGAFALSLGGALTTAGALTLTGAFGATFAFTNTTSVTFPTSGTLATISQIPTGAALTATPDTNVTISLGGSPSTALLNAASITLGWTGQLSIARGGTGISSFGTGVQTALGQNTLGSGGIALSTDTTWTPSLKFGGATTGITYTKQVGQYSQVGNTIVFSMFIVLSSKGSATGNASINLPVATRAGSNSYTFDIYPENITYSGQMKTSVSSGSTGISFVSVSSGGTGTVLTDAAFTNTTDFIISGAYLI